MSMAEPPYLFVSTHDWRSARRSSEHFIVAELARRGPTRMAGIGFSHVSRLNRDPRLPLWDRANRIEVVDGVEAYLWRGLAHPVDPGTRWLDAPARAWFAHYASTIPGTLRAWVRESRTIILESGLAVVLFDAVRDLNPTATLLYYAADDVRTIGCSPAIVETLARTAPLYDGVALTSPALAASLPPGCRLGVVPHGVDPGLAALAGASPYRAARNAVSVGSMQFDAEAVRAVAAAAPDMEVHVIGAGRAARGLSAPNIVVHGEMPFAGTIPFVAHASVGLAPYRHGPGEAYLADTSLKLLQYAALGVPALCPAEVVGRHVGRFGYRRGDPASIATALAAALRAGPQPPRCGLAWNEVVDRLLDPGTYEGGPAAQAARPVAVPA